MMDQGKNPENLDRETRKALFENYTKMVEAYYAFEEELAHALGREHPAFLNAEAYPLGAIETGLRAEKYVTYNPTLASLLEGLGIIDDDGEFIELDEDGEDED